MCVRLSKVVRRAGCTPRLAACVVVAGHHPEVTPGAGRRSARTEALARRGCRLWRFDLGPLAGRGLTDGVGQGDQIVVGGHGRRVVALMADQFPSVRHGETTCVGIAQVIAVGLACRRERSHHSRGIRVDICQCGHRWLAAAVPGATPIRPHPTKLPLVKVEPVALSSGREPNSRYGGAAGHRTVPP